jgi:DNA-binding CsgD family transcriptional regulator
MVGGNSVVRVETFVGRSHLIQQMQKRLESIEDGNAQMVVIQGEAGIGKTQLAREFVRYAENTGWFALRGSAQQGLAFSPLIEAFRRYADQLPLSNKGKLGQTYPYLNALIPSLGGPLPEPLAESSLERARWFENLRMSMVSLCEEWPLLIWLDNMEEADKDTIEWLHYFLQHTNQRRILLLVTCRIQDTLQSPPFLKLIQFLSREQRLQTIELGPLTSAESHELIKSHLIGNVQDSTLEFLHSHTKGIPFYILELMNHLKTTGNLYKDQDTWNLLKGSLDPIPLSIRLLIEPKILGLSEDEMEILCLFTASRRGLPLVILEKALWFDRPLLIKLLTGLLRKGILLEEAFKGDIVYSFSHPMFRVVVESKIHLIELKQAHQKMAKAWYELDVLYSADHILEIEDHLGGFFTATILFQAGERYLDLRSYDTAIEYFEKAVRHLKEAKSEKDNKLRFEVRLMLSEALTYKQNPKQALILLHELFEESDNILMKIRMKRFMAWVEQTRSFEECLKHLNKGLTLWEGQKENQDILWILNAKVFNDLNSGQVAEAKQSIKMLRDYAERFPNPRARLLHALREAHLSLMDLGSPPIELTQANALLPEAYKLKDPELIYDVYCLFGYNALNHGDFSRSLRFAKEGTELVRQHGMIIHEISIRLAGMCALFMQGSWEAAYLEAEAVEKLSLDYEVSGAVVCTLDLRALILYLQDKEEWQTPFQESQTLIFDVFPEMGMTLSDDALHVINALEEVLGDVPIDSRHRPIYWANAHGMQYFFRLLEGIRLIKGGLWAEAKEQVQKLRQSEPEKEPNYRTGILFLLEGLRILRSKESDPKLALEHLAKAIRCFEKLRVPLEKALSQVFLAEVTNDFEQGKALLKQSFEELQSIGALALCRWVNQKLANFERGVKKDRHSGVRIPPLSETLTKRETQILETLALGFSNREIALNLGVTEGTIKNHIVNIYGKLGVNSRVQAIVKAREYGIITPS